MAKLKPHHCKRCGKLFVSAAGGRCYSCIIKIAKQNQLKYKKK